MDKRAFKIKATFTYDIEQEVHAYDENDALYDFEDMLKDEVTHVLNKNNLLYNHLEYEEIEEISKETLRQRSYYNCERDVA